MKRGVELSDTMRVDQQHHWLVVAGFLVVIALSAFFVVGLLPIVPGALFSFFPEAVPPFVTRALFIFGGLASLTIIVKPQIGLFLIVLYVPFQYGLRDLVGGNQLVGLVDDYVMLLVVGRLLFDLGVRKRWQSTPVDPYIGALVLVGVVGIILNSVPMVAAVQGLRTLVQPFLFFYLAVYYLPGERTFRRLVTLLLVIALLQTPFAIAQFDPNNADAVRGTLGIGFHNAFGYFLAIPVFLLVGFYKHFGRLRYFLFILLLISLTVLASSRSVYFFIPAGILFLYRENVLRGIRLNAGALARAVAIFAVVLLAFLIVMQLTPERPTEAEGWPSVARLWRAQLDPVRSTGRLAWIPITLDALGEEGRYLFGLGPLMWGSKPASATHSELFRDAIEKYYGNSIASQLVVALGEYGFIGVILFYALFFRMFRFISRLKRRENDRYWKAICVALEGGVLVFAVGGLIQSTWLTQVTSYYVWFLFAGAFRRYLTYSESRAE